MTTAPRRIDVHQHLVPPLYRDALAKSGIVDAGGRALPDWSAGAALEQMDLLGTEAAILSVSTPGTGFLGDPGEAADLARRLNDFSAALTSEHPSRFGWFATLPMPDVTASAREAERALRKARPRASTKSSGRSASMSCFSRSARPMRCQIRMTSSSVEIARARA